MKINRGRNHKREADLERKAWVEYERIERHAFAEYKRIQQQAIAEYRKIEQQALAEYERIRRAKDMYQEIEKQ